MPLSPLEPLSKVRPRAWGFAAAAHLLNRAGFGGTVAQVDALAAMTPDQAAASLVAVEKVPDPLPALAFGDLTGGGGGPGQRAGAFGMLRSMSPEQRRSMQQLRQIATTAKFDELKFWWLDRMVRSPRPLEEKMTLFWHGLFVSSYATVKNVYHLYLQNQLFRKHALGDYKALTLAVSQDPAMLEYLNNNQNRKAKPNENYARELMELFTMGIGNYTEADIKESARAFTGWSFAGDRFVFQAREHDSGPKTFLGKTGNWDGTDIIDIIFNHPATPRYIATRLLKFFATDDTPPPEVVTALAGVVKSNKFKMAPTLQTLFASDWFYSQDVMRRQIKSPVQLVVGALRQLGVTPADPRAMDNSLKMMGQELFNAPTVKGWDGGRDWINTATLFARYNLPAYLVTGKLPNTGRGAAPGADRAQFAAFSSPWSPQHDLADAAASTTDGIVDYYIRKLINVPVAADKRSDLIEFLNGTGDAKCRVFDPVGKDADMRITALVHLVMAMADYQIC